jgi:diacylglycerol kinase (ATP)
MKIHVIANPYSRRGNGKDLLRILWEKFADTRVHIHRTDDPSHATELARRAVLEGADTIVAGGGDGTVNAVLNGIVGSGVALGIIPSGTANDLASYHRIPGDVVSACDIIRARRVQPVDLVRVNGWCYATTGGLGLPAEVASQANALKRRTGVSKLLALLLGSHVYGLTALRLLPWVCRDSNPIEIRRPDGATLRTDAVAFLVANQPFIGARFVVAPRASNVDGKFDVCLIENPKNFLCVASVLMKFFLNKDTTSPWVRAWCAEHLVVTAERPMAFLGDGETTQEGSYFEIGVLPRALNLIVP